MIDRYYVYIQSSKDKNHVMLCHGPCTEQEADLAMQEINSRLSRPPFAGKSVWPEDNPLGSPGDWNWLQDFMEDSPEHPLR